MKAIEQYFHVVLFIVLYMVVLTFMFVDETLVCDHSNESYWAVLSCGAVCFWQFCKMKFKIFPLSFELGTLGIERVVKQKNVKSQTCRTLLAGGPGLIPRSLLALLTKKDKNWIYLLC